MRNGEEITKRDVFRVAVAAVVLTPFAALACGMIYLVLYGFQILIGGF